MLPEPAVLVAVLVALLAPLLPTVALGLSELMGARLPELRVAALTRWCLLIAWLASLVAAAGVFFPQVRSIPIYLGQWFAIRDYQFELGLLADELSVSMLVLTTTLGGLIGRFSFRYLHREPGYTRFFLLLALFESAMALLVMAGNIDLTFAGWELVGITSAMLIGFFQERDQPARHGLRAFVTYRVCDAGLLLGAVFLHHYAHTADFDAAFGPGQWPLGVAHLSQDAATLLGGLFLFAALGKSAQFPVGGWLPRAMEGPTPSSAIFYGALSIHAGAYLLLRVSPLLHEAPAVARAAVVVGALTAVHGVSTGRAQTDIKSQLAYAAMAQSGLIFVEIGLGLYQLALWHIVAHAILRAWQLLRSPSVLHDHHQLHAAAGGAPLPVGGYWDRVVPKSVAATLYRAALERAYLDPFLERFVVRPVLRLAQAIERLERWWTRLLGGLPSEQQRDRAAEARVAVRSKP